MRGEGEFWPTNGWAKATDSPKWDAEQIVPVFVAVQAAMACKGSAEDRLRIIVAAVAKAAHEMADARAEAMA